MESKLHFTYYFPFISANSISFSHCFLSLISINFFSSESLFRRQIGVLIFQIRTFLDCLDGVVFRAHAKNQRYKSYYGDFGYYIDAFSDILGGTCLVIGCLFYFFKQRPVRLITRRTRVNPTNEEIELMITDDIEDEQKLPETKERILISLSLFALRYSLAAMFWDRNVHAYEDLLDSYTDKTEQQVRNDLIKFISLSIIFRLYN
jgi:hypothetical protein